ncbi:hypothetical protein LVJ59_15135 [Microbacterium sp. KKR3/1]|uniref:hypothetical protein n=1 Tax=Microbacterium sp. KKR3/1 TaxID=2904241 RepID=UPI001E3A6752|nr:hypothetical protein [Microbacterium sp. KKR3/1]MCE0510382.1 hypothetical protein [Microbacterium sp. KKR3/1]
MTAVQRACYVPHEPVGSRCYGASLNGSEHQFAEWDFSVREAHAEIDALHSNSLDPKLSPAEHAEYASQLQILMHKARAGTVRFVGRDAEGNVVGGHIVELKPRLRYVREVFGRKPRLLRLYLGEPSVHPRMLLALGLATKEASLDGLSEQDADIAEAKARAEAWCQPSPSPVV